MQLAAAAGLLWTGLYLYVPLLPAHARSLGASGSWIGAIAAAYGVAQLLLRLPVGVAADRPAGPKPWVLFGCLSVVIAGALFATAEAPAGLLASRLMGGVAATMWVPFTVLFVMAHPGSTRTAMSVLMTVNGVAILSGQSLGPLIAEALSVTGVAWIGAATGGAALLLVAPVSAGHHQPRAASGSVSSGRGTVVSVIRNRALREVAVLGAVLHYVIMGASFAFVFDLARERFGVATAVLGLLALAGNLPAAVAPMLTGETIRARVPTRWLLAGTFGVTTVAVGLLAAAPTVTALFVAQVLAGSARGIGLPVLMAEAVDAVPEDSTATAMGLFQATYAAGIVIGPAATGVLVDWFGFTMAFSVMAILPAVATLHILGRPGPAHGRMT